MFKSTKEAIEFILYTYNMSKYKLAKDLNAFPSSINQWLKGTRMSKPYADLIFELYDITITDVR